MLQAYCHCLSVVVSNTATQEGNKLAHSENFIFKTKINKSML